MFFKSISISGRFYNDDKKEMTENKREDISDILARNTIPKTNCKQMSNNKEIDEYQER